MELKGLINVTEQHLILHRGAYTARKVAGLIVSRRLRLVDHILIKNTHRIESDFWKPSISANYSAFGVNSLTATHLLFHRVPDALGSSYWFTHSFIYWLTRLCRCVGVWDTVGSVIGHIDELDIKDSSLPDTVDIALHALSIHENRKLFLPTLWTVPTGGLSQNRLLKQMCAPYYYRNTLLMNSEP